MTERKMALRRAYLAVILLLVILLGTYYMKEASKPYSREHEIQLSAKKIQILESRPEDSEIMFMDLAVYFKNARRNPELSHMIAPLGKGKVWFGTEIKGARHAAIEDFGPPLIVPLVSVKTEIQIVEGGRVKIKIISDPSLIGELYILAFWLFFASYLFYCFYKISRSTKNPV